MGGGESQKTQEGDWRQAYSERRFGVLLVILVVLLAGPPILLGFGLSAAWFDGLMALLMVAVILSLCFERHQRLFALLLGIPTVLLSLGGHALPGEASVPVLFAGHLCEVLFLFGGVGADREVAVQRPHPDVRQHPRRCLRLPVPGAGLGRPVLDDRGLPARPWRSARSWPRAASLPARCRTS